MQADENFYISRSSKLLKSFDKALKPVRKVFVTNFGDELADRILEDARQEYEALIPELPYWGKKNMMTGFLIGSSYFLAIYRVLKKHGKSGRHLGSGLGYLDCFGEMVECKVSKCSLPVPSTDGCRRRR